VDEMNVEAAVVIFDGVSNRKKYIKDRIKLIENFDNDTRKEFDYEFEVLNSELAWLTKLQIDVIRALYNGK
jgi:hypothetical protein